MHVYRLNQFSLLFVVLAITTGIWDDCRDWTIAATTHIDSILLLV